MARQFNDIPIIRHARSRFDLSHGIKTAGNVGTLYPFEVQEVYAGDTFKVRTSTVTRLTSQFLRPVMDNLFLDVYYFYVPSRILYNKWVNIFGENTDSKWAVTEEVSAPQIPVGEEVVSGSVADFLGLPLGKLKRPVSVLPFRALAKVYEDWFRDQNNVNPMHVQNGDYARVESLNSNEWAPNNYTGLPPKVAKFHDYFTSCLPSPQKGSAVDLQLASGGDIPVRAIGDKYAVDKFEDPLKWVYSGIVGSGYNAKYLPLYTRAANLAGRYAQSTQILLDGLSQDTVDSDHGGSTQVAPANLWADGSKLEFSPISVNDMRYAFQLQKMLERDARSGTRYVEYLASHFGVQSGDYRLQRSEYLGGKRVPLTITQVVQSTGSGSDSSPLGEVGAYSLSNSKSRFTKSFVEHGFVIGVFCIRQHHTYQQGIEKFWTRSKRTDFYDPVFSHIGEQPVFTSELYAQVDPDQVFGYNEAWADLRYRPNYVTGKMRSGATDNLDVWHFADNYSSAPTLNEQFIEETPTYVDRAITVESSSQPQFILDFWVQNIAYRNAPTYSIPSLIDHD